LKRFLFTEGPITAIEPEAGAGEAQAVASLAIGSLRKSKETEK
jgi:hypothetical protein